MPPPVLMNFVVFPPGCGYSVADFWGWDAHEVQLRCPDEVSGDMCEDEIPGWGLKSKSTNYPDHGHHGDLPLPGKIFILLLLIFWSSPMGYLVVFGSKHVCYSFEPSGDMGLGKERGMSVVCLFCTVQLHVHSNYSYENHLRKMSIHFCLLCHIVTPSLLAAGWSADCKEVDWCSQGCMTLHVRRLVIGVCKHSEMNCVKLDSIVCSLTPCSL